MSTEQTITPTSLEPVTDAYRKAHKSYVLVSALLASWELIGITLETKERWGIELKSPAAVPLILFTLVFYSGYKMTIEWLQCDRGSRKNPAAQVDFRVAHGIAFIAIAILAVQYLWRIQIVNVVKARLTHPDGAIVFGLLMSGLMTAELWEERGSPWKKKAPNALGALFFFCFAVGWAIELRSQSGTLHMLTTTSVSILMLSIMATCYYHLRKWLDLKLEAK